MPLFSIPDGQFLVFPQPGFRHKILGTQPPNTVKWKGVPESIKPQYETHSVAFSKKLISFRGERAVITPEKNS